MPVLPKKELLGAIKASRKIYLERTKEDISLYRLIEHFSLYTKALKQIRKESDLTFSELEILVICFGLIHKKGFATNRAIERQTDLTREKVRKVSLVLVKKGYLTNYKEQDRPHEVLGYIVTDKGLNIIQMWLKRYKSLIPGLSIRYYQNQMYRGIFKQVMALYKSIE
jgi:hypothetical protein